MTIKEMYKYKDVVFLMEATVNEVNYYVLEANDMIWQDCTQYDFLQAKYYGKPVSTDNILVEQKESIK